MLIAEFINGWTDAPNAIATVVSTGVMAPRSAIAMAVVLNTVGAMAGTAVAATVGKGIVSSTALTLPAITAAMIAIIAWGSFAAKVGLPISKSHSLLAGLAGAGFAGGGLAALQWSGWTKVFIGMFCAIPFGFWQRCCSPRSSCASAGNMRPGRAKRFFDRAQIVSAGFMAFNHGLNDGQKFMGVFALTLLLGGATTQFEIPLWVILVCALTMGLGTSFGGWRIIETVGLKDDADRRPGRASLRRRRRHRRFSSPRCSASRCPRRTPSRPASSAPAPRGGSETFAGACSSGSRWRGW